MLASHRRASAVLLVLLHALNAVETSFEGLFLLKFSSEDKLDLCLGDTGKFDPCDTGENQQAFLWRAIPVDIEHGESLSNSRIL